MYTAFLKDVNHSVLLGAVPVSDLVFALQTKQPLICSQHILHIFLCSSVL